MSIALRPTAKSPTRILLLIVSILILIAANPLDAAAKAKAKRKSKPSAATAATSITAPASGATVSGTFPITVTIGTGVTWVNVYVDGVHIGSTPPLTFNFDSTTVANASHTISANAYASDGTLLGTASETVTVQNANQTPALTVTSPTNMSTVSGNVTITAVVNASVEWTDFNIDGPIFAASPPYSVTWDSTSVPDGQHTIEVSAYDRNDNQIGDVIVTVSVANHVTTGGPISLRSTSIGSTSAASDHVTINAPVGVSAGDVLVAEIATRGSTGTPLTGPPGWILAAHDVAGSTIIQAVFYHVVPASPAEPASYTWTWLNTSNDAAGGIADYVGVDNLNPIDDINGATNTGTTTIGAPAVSIPSGHTTDRVVAMYSAASSSLMTLPGALAPQWNFHAIGWGIEIAMGDLNLTTASSNAETATVPGDAFGNGQQLALLPAGVSNVAHADRTSSNAPGVSVSGTTVTALVPFGSDDTDPVNAANVVIENSSGTLPSPTIITTDRVNACATFASTGTSMCSGQGGSVDFIAPGATSSTIVSDGISGSPINYTGGDCAGCGIAADDFLGLGIFAGEGGFQLVNPANNSISAPIPGNGEPVPVDFGYDPIGHRILSANYDVTNSSTFASSPPLYEIFNLYRSGSEVFDLLGANAFFQQPGRTCTGSNGTTYFNDLLPDSNAIDTSTNIAFVTFHSPAQCFSNPPEDIALFDLNQASFTTTGVDGGWNTAGKQIQSLTGLTLGGVTAISVVSGAHLAVVSDQFSDLGYIGALKLPSTSGTGVPAIADWVDVQMPADPSGKPWNNWHQPSGLGSYTSPNNGKAMGVIMNFAQDTSSNPIGPTYLAIVDLQALLNAPRDSSGHAVATSVNLITSGIVRFVKVQ